MPKHFSTSSPSRFTDGTRLFLCAAIALALSVGVPGIVNDAVADPASLPRGDVVSSPAKDHIFLVAKGEKDRTIDKFDPKAGQRIRLTGFGAMSLDGMRARSQQVGADLMLDLGDNQRIWINKADMATVAAVQIQLDRSGLVRTFEDEFNELSWDSQQETGKTTGTWRTNFGYGNGPAHLDSRTLVNNGELQVYTDPLFKGTSNASLDLNPFRTKAGVLDIIATPLTKDAREKSWNRTYSSGLLTTRASFAQQYGVFEIRAKTPRGKGLWPAFWLLPSAGGWPPEIDILEILGDNPSKLHVSWHSNVGGSHTSDTKTIDVADTSTDFHTYSVEWTKDTINWFFDDLQIASKATPADMQQAMYLLVNLAVGGNWPGSPNAATVFPAVYSIDWVRAYRR